MQHWTTEAHEAEAQEKVREEASKAAAEAQTREGQPGSLPRDACEIARDARIFCVLSEGLQAGVRVGVCVCGVFVHVCDWNSNARKHVCGGCMCGSAFVWRWHVWECMSGEVAGVPHSRVGVQRNRVNELFVMPLYTDPRMISGGYIARRVSTSTLHHARPAGVNL
jgi:hypothetical protein